jgi:hypothetical protein
LQVFHVNTEGFDGGVEEEADVAFGHAHDAGDVAVAEAVLEFEAQGLALSLGELLEKSGELSGGIALQGDFVRQAGRIGEAGLVLGGEGLHGFGLSVHVEDAGAADAEQPGRLMSLQSGSIGAAEAQEGFLNRVAGGGQIAAETQRVAAERAFVLADKVLELAGPTAADAAPLEVEGAAHA